MVRKKWDDQAQVRQDRYCTGLLEMPWDLTLFYNAPLEFAINHKNPIMFTILHNPNPHPSCLPSQVVTSFPHILLPHPPFYTMFQPLLQLVTHKLATRFLPSAFLFIYLYISLFILFTQTQCNIV